MLRDAHRTTGPAPAPAPGTPAVAPPGPAPAPAPPGAVAVRTAGSRPGTRAAGGGGGGTAGSCTRTRCGAGTRRFGTCRGRGRGGRRRRARRVVEVVDDVLVSSPLSPPPHAVSVVAITAAAMAAVTEKGREIKPSVMVSPRFLSLGLSSKGARTHSPRLSTAELGWRRCPSRRPRRSRGGWRCSSRERSSWRFWTPPSSRRPFRDRRIVRRRRRRRQRRDLRLPGHRRGADSRQRVDGRPVRHPPGVHRRDRGVHDRLDRMCRERVAADAGRHAGAAGRRRRDDGARRPAGGAALLATSPIWCGPSRC